MTLIQRILQWATRKWETAEDWLPKAIALGLIPVVILIYLLSRNNGRGPASFEEISDSDVPAETIYSSTKLTSPVSKAAPFRLAQALATVRDPTLTKSAISRRLGIPMIRARAVIFDRQLLSELKKRQPGQEYRLPLALFPDYEKTVHLKVVSGFEVNKGLHSGVIDGDESSKVQLSIEDNSIAIRIESRDGHFRIIHDPITGYDYVVEVDR